MPLADRFLRAEQLAEAEPRYPLEVVHCDHCSLLQISETVAPEILFCDDYPYYSSISEQLLRHSRDNALELIEARGLGGDSLVVELASNDGYLLRNYLQRDIPVLGIDPAEGPARAAQAIGVTTLNRFFSAGLASELAAQGKLADVIHANNVLAHVADLNGFVQGVATLLKDNGMAVFEVPYARSLLDHCEFDTIYHEHLCYFSVTALDALLRRHHLFLNDVRQLAIHGGSLRLYVERQQRPSATVTELLATEAQWVRDRAYYQRFAAQVAAVRTDLLDLLRRLREAGKSVAGYGAAAKGSILLNVIGIDPDLLAFVVDRSPHKQGLHMPGQRQPIHAPEELLRRMPDYVLLLAWNFAGEIRAQQATYEARGGRFILPLPRPRILEPAANG
jgi:SAM-dependent methyltransferase